MKALSLWQPYASFMFANLPNPPKTIETRTRPSKHRGLLAIHATAKEPTWIREEWLGNMDKITLLRSYLQDLTAIIAGVPYLEKTFDELPRGRILGTVEVMECRPVIEARRIIGPLEWALGDFAHGRHAIFTRNPRKLITPVPWKGKQGFWNLPDDFTSQEEPA